MVRKTYRHWLEELIMSEGYDSKELKHLILTFYVSIPAPNHNQSSLAQLGSTSLFAAVSHISSFPPLF